MKFLRDSIVFTFVQVSREGFFRNETNWGFKISGADIDAGKERWGLVSEVGPDVKYVKPGQYILIEPLKWTTGIEIENQTLWRTKEEFVVATSDIKPEGLV